MSQHVTVYGMNELIKAVSSLAENSKNEKELKEQIVLVEELTSDIKHKEDTICWMQELLESNKIHISGLYLKIERLKTT